MIPMVESAAVSASRALRRRNRMNETKQKKEAPVEIWEEGGVIQALQMGYMVSDDAWCESRARKQNGILVPYEDALTLLALARTAGANVNPVGVEKLYGQFSRR